MNAIRSFVRRHQRWTAPLAALLLLGAAWIAGVHHHADSSSHACAVCVVAHTPVVVEHAVGVVQAPVPHTTALTPAPVLVPARRATPAALSRGPPIA